MRALHLQRILALVFLTLGAWAMFLPGSVELLAIRPEYRTGGEAVTLALGCFGAQAILAGVLIWFSRFEPRTFLVFGLVASVPFLFFDAYFYFVHPLFTPWVAADALGNLVILACGLVGWKLSSAEMLLPAEA